MAKYGGSLIGHHALQSNNKKKKKKLTIEKSYDFQKSMLYAIQSTTQEPTHEIIANLVENIDEHAKAAGLDITKTPEQNVNSPSWTFSYGGNEKRIRKYMYYPGTKIYVGMYLVYSDYQTDDRDQNADGYLRYSFKLPTTSLKMDQQEYDDYITDGILCDSSKDVEEPDLNATLTKEEAAIREKLRKERAKKK